MSKPRQIDDLFAVPLGTVPAGEPEESIDHSPVFPKEVDDYRGQWVALRQNKIVAVRATEAELRKALGDDHLGVRLFRVPTSDVIAR